MAIHCGSGSSIKIVFLQRKGKGVWIVGRKKARFYPALNVFTTEKSQHTIRHIPARKRC